ncbi:MAG TPA: GNAT family N-acetyltransferase [Jatrophihabitans sp.]|nr:GNAT family N-acetyltransferase [Jatrophihabitans sp.]
MGTWNGLELDGLELQSGELLLRPWSPADAPLVADIMRDDRMSEYLPLPRPYTLRDARDYVTRFAVDGRRTGTRIECAMELAGELVGSAALQLPGAGHEPAIGYWVAGSHWGKGLATRAARALADFGFAQGLHRIEIRADQANTASAAVALQAGFRYEGTLRSSNRSQHGWSDHALFARLDTDPGERIAAGLPRLRRLADDRIELRPVTAADWPVLLAEAANAESRRWGFGDEPDEAAMRARAAAAGLQWLTGRSASMLILDLESGQGAGTISLWRSGPPGVARIGYGILPEFRGQRFTTRALRLLTNWAFEQAGLARLELGCKVDNVASARSAELAGFVRDARLAGRLRNPDGSYSDEIGFGLVRRG